MSEKQVENKKNLLLRENKKFCLHFSTYSSMNIKYYTYIYVGTQATCLLFEFDPSKRLSRLFSKYWTLRQHMYINRKTHLIILGMYLDFVWT